MSKIYGIRITDLPGSYDEDEWFDADNFFTDKDKAIRALKVISREEFPECEYVIEMDDKTICKKTILDEDNSERRIYQVVELELHD